MSIVSTKLDAKHSDQARHKRINNFDLLNILIFSIPLPLCPLALGQSHTDPLLQSLEVRESKCLSHSVRIEITLTMARLLFSHQPLIMSYSNSAM